MSTREERSKVKALSAIQKAEETALDLNATDAQFQRYNQLAGNAVAAYAEVIGVSAVEAALRLRQDI